MFKNSNLKLIVDVLCPVAFQWSWIIICKPLRIHYLLKRDAVTETIIVASWRETIMHCTTPSSIRIIILIHTLPYMSYLLIQTKCCVILIKRNTMHIKENSFSICIMKFLKYFFCDIREYNVIRLLFIYFFFIYLT